MGGASASGSLDSSGHFAHHQHVGHGGDANSLLKIAPREDIAAGLLCRKRIAALAGVDSPRLQAWRAEEASKIKGASHWRNFGSAGSG